MESKLARLKKLMADGEYAAALKLAASWPRLGDHKEAITRGWNALQSPDFYRQLGDDPQRLVDVGIDAICERYGIVR